MNADQFIESAGEEVSAYKTADLTLYYTNETGDKLVEQRVAMEYDSNIALEKLIVERLIAGPPFEGAYPTIPTNTKLVSISIKDKIQAAREEVSGKDEKARQEPEQGRAAPPGRR